MRKGLALAAFTGICWALLAIGLKYALQFTSSGTIVWVRMAWAAALLSAIFYFRNPSHFFSIFKKSSFLALASGSFLAANYFTYMKGLEMTSASNAQIMIQLGPLLFLFVGVFLFNESLKLLQWMGLAIALTGFGLFNWDQILVAIELAKNNDSLSAQNTYIIGNIWLVTGAVTWAVFAGFQKKIINSQILKPQELNLIIYLLSSLLLLPLAQIGELAHLSFNQHFILFLLGLNTLLAYGAFAEANKLAPASYVSLIISCNPLLTIAILKTLETLEISFISTEPIYWRGFLGAGLVVTGVCIAVAFRGYKKTS